MIFGYSALSSQMEQYSTVLNWVVDTLAQGSTVKPPRALPVLRGTSQNL